MSSELTEFLLSHGIATSRATTYNPEGNGQVERYNGIIWKTVNLALKTKNLKVSQWEIVLPDALHSIRSLLCTATNCTPHERMFIHKRKSTSGTSVPSWLTPAQTVLLKNHNRRSKYDPLVEEVDLIEVNPEYALIRHNNGKESTVSLKHLAPRGDTSLIVQDESISSQQQEQDEVQVLPNCTQDEESLVDQTNIVGMNEENIQNRHSTRSRQLPKYLEDYSHSLNNGGENVI
jgi:hypothetical protein